MNACTIIARNYLPAARVLADSFALHHPGASFTVVIVDDEDGQVENGTEDFDILHLWDLDFEPRELGRMLLLYDVTEISTAIKPWVLSYFLDRGATQVLYFDPDIQIFAPMEDYARAAEESGIVLTPHTAVPMPRDGKKISEAELMASGIFNLGFVGVGRSATEFLDWWKERLRRDCIVDPQNMLFVDQRWVDMVPGLFPHRIVQDPGANVAYWNLHGRRVERTGELYTVNGKALRFFHFSGYDPDVPHLLSKHQGDNPRILLSEHPAVAELVQEYGRRMSAAGRDLWMSEPYGHDYLANGVRLDRHMRRIYRRALVEAEALGNPEPPNPFLAHSDDAFLGWLGQPDPTSGRPLNRYLDHVYQARLDLQLAFPHIPGPDTERFLAWARSQGRIEVGIPERFLSAPRPGYVPESEPEVVLAPGEEGVNIAGYFRAELGVGEAGRLLLEAVKAAGIPHTVVLNSETPSRQNHPFDTEASSDAPYDISIVCVNADRTPSFAIGEGRRLFANHYVIGQWFWEVEKLPDSMMNGFDFVDEVWVTGEHTRKALQALTAKPVLSVPLPVLPPPVDRAITRLDLGLPEESYIFLFTFDFFSVLARKNPLGLVEAFREAFPEESGALLVLKSINGRHCVVEMERLRAAVAGRKDIILIDEYWDRGRKNALAALCDCYVSLHRAEGFGLTLAEAMALGKPVIATGYSGNLDFMTDENSYLVPYVMTKIGVGADPYPASARWAEPDLHEAARLMRYVCEHPERAAAIGARARHDILTARSPEVAGQWVKTRLSAIRDTQNDAPPAKPVAMDETAFPPREHAGETDAPTQPAPAASGSLALAASLLQRAPDVHSPTRRGGPWAWAVRRVRRAVFRILHNYHHDQRVALRALVAAVQESEARSERMVLQAVRANRELESRIRREERERRKHQDATRAVEVQLERSIRELQEMALELHGTAARAQASAVSRLSAALAEYRSELAVSARRFDAVESHLERVEDSVGTRLVAIENLLHDESKFEAMRLSLEALTEEMRGLVLLRDRVDVLEGHQGTVQDAVGSRFAALEAELQDSVGTRLVAIENLLHDESKFEAMRLSLEALTEEMRGLVLLRDRVDMLEGHQGAVQDSLGTRFAALEAELHDLAPSRLFEERLAVLDTTLQSLLAEVNAVPFMTEPLMIDRDGEQVLGYRLGEEERQKGYAYFEDVFRGEEEFIKKRQSVYLHFVSGLCPVVDVGCGRGEFLELLQDANICAVGVEPDESQAQRARAKGLRVEETDALSYLRSADSGTVGAIFCAQVIEHLSPDDILDFLQLAHDRLQSGGRLIVETVNPNSLRAFKMFWVDPTHKVPIFPETMLELFRQQGFSESEVFFPNGTGVLDRDRRFAGEYAVIGMK